MNILMMWGRVHYQDILILNYSTQANHFPEKDDTLHMKKAHCFRFVESKNLNM